MTHELLEQDQRYQWWQNYATAKGLENKSMPSHFERDDFAEITAQPLLNYLVAIGFGDERKVMTTKSVGLNSIYERLLDAVYERAYGGGPLPGVETIPLQHFNRVLEEIGVAVWHGNGRTASVREIEEHCQTNGMDRLLEQFRMYATGAESGITRVLTAFYFRQRGRRSSGDQTFEFTHKSFGEYLAVRRIVRTVRRMCDELTTHEKTFGDQGWDHRTALRHWLDVAGHAPLDQYLVAFLGREIQIQKNRTLQSWQKRLSELLSSAVQNGMPLEQVAPRRSFHDECTHARNAEESLLVVLNLCANATQRISNVIWPVDRAFHAWFARLESKRAGDGTEIQAREYLSWLDLHGCHLEGADLRKADLANCNLESATLRDANLRESGLDCANLAGADLQMADLRGASVNDVKVDNANLFLADCKGTSGMPSVNGSQVVIDSLKYAPENILTSIDFFDLSVRARNCLEIAQINTIGDLMRRSEDELLQIRNFGETTLNEVREKLHEYGLMLSSESPLSTPTAGMDLNL